MIPPALGRGLVVSPGAAPPPGWGDVARIRVDDETAAAPLHEAWSQRRAVIVELGIDAGRSSPRNWRRASDR